MSQQRRPEPRQTPGNASAFQLLLNAGATADTLAAAGRLAAEPFHVVDLLEGRTADEGPETVFAAENLLRPYKEGALHPADVKSAMLVCSDSPSVGVVAYGVLVGFAGRWPHVQIGDTTLDLSRFVDRGRTLAAASLEPIEDVSSVRTEGVYRVGFTDDCALRLDPDAPFAGLNGEPLAWVRYAERVVLDLPDDPLMAFSLFAAVSGIRATARKSFRVPMVNTLGATVDIFDLQFAAREVRYALPQGELVAPRKLSPTAKLLMSARSAEIIPVLTALGSVSGDGELWRCTRPWNHRHGDANPSMSVEGNMAKCPVCDSEELDPLTLVLATLPVGPVEAANFIGSVQAA